MTEFNYSKDIKINKYKLDHEWERQADLYLKWSIKAGEVAYTKDVYKTRLEATKAELDERIRRNPKRYDLRASPTNPEVDAAVLRHPLYRKALRRYIKKQKEVRVFEAVKDALHQKKYALENLVKLKLSGYFSEPTIPPGDEHMMYTAREQEEIRKLNRPEVKRRFKKGAIDGNKDHKKKRQ